jgi:hypothetical protein
LVVDSQSHIGWKHLLFGRLSKEWARVQHNHIHSEELDPDKFSGDSWGTKVIQQLWTGFLSLWTERNKALHGITHEENEAKSEYQNAFTAFFFGASKVEAHLRQYSRPCRTSGSITREYQ